MAVIIALRKTLLECSYERGDSYDYISKGQLMSYLFIRQDGPELYKYWEAQKEWQWKVLM